MLVQPEGAKMNHHLKLYHIQRKFGELQMLQEAKLPT